MASSVFMNPVYSGVVFDPRDRNPDWKNYKLRTHPLYCVDLFPNPYFKVVTAICYQLDKKSVREYHRSNHSNKDVGLLNKKMRIIPCMDGPYGAHPSTTLAKAANKSYMRHPRTYWKRIISKPIFSSIVSHNTDTFTKEWGAGFPERNLTRIIHRTIRQGYGSTKSIDKIEQGSYTGVFISLNNIILTHSYIPTSSVLDTLVHNSDSVLEPFLT